MMKKNSLTKTICFILTFLYSVSFVSGAVFAGDYGSAGRKSFLWKTKSQGSTVYLLGSIHFATPDIYPLNKNITDAFGRSDVVAVEIDITNLDLGQYQMQMMAQAMYTDGSMLSQKVSNKIYMQAKTKLSQFGLPIETFEMAKPWFIAMTLQSLALQKLGYDPTHGIDYYFLKKASGVKKVVELESAQFQINLLNSFSDYEQELFLLHTINQLHLLEEKMIQLITMWVNGQANALEDELFNKELTEHPELASIYAKFYVDRNIKMTEKVEGFLNQPGTYFVIVGAGHLIGEQGIVQLLENKGYTVDQL